PPPCAPPAALFTWTGPKASLQATHEALFQFWFPLKKLNIPPALKAEVTLIAQQVDAGMFADFQTSSLLALLEGMTKPTLLPFYSSLAASSYPAVRAFITSSGRFTTMPHIYRQPLFSFLFSGSAG